MNVMIWAAIDFGVLISPNPTPPPPPVEIVVEVEVSDEPVVVIRPQVDDEEEEEPVRGVWSCLIPSQNLATPDVEPAPYWSIYSGYWQPWVDDLCVPGIEERTA